jgi:hypothetical protein
VNVALPKSTTTLACVRRSIRVCARRPAAAAITHAATAVVFTIFILLLSFSGKFGWIQPENLAVSVAGRVLKTGLPKNKNLLNPSILLKKKNLLNL